MSANWKICFFISFIILFIQGCTQKNLEKNITVSKNIQKKQVSYKECKKYEKIMKYASSYIKEEFEKAYFLQNDIIGAKAQVYLIEKNSPTVFAENINAARNSYKLQYQLAKKRGCNIQNFKTFPLENIKKHIESLEKKENR